MSTYAELENDPKARNLENALEQALKEAVDDDTYRKVKRMSYSSNAAGEIAERLFGHGAGSAAQGMSTAGGQIGNPMAAHRSSGTKTTADLKLLEKLVTSLLETHNGQGGEGSGGRSDGMHRSGSVLGRFRPMSRSFRMTSSLRRRAESTNNATGTSSTGGAGGTGGEGATGGGGLMPTIQESGTDRNSDRGRRNSWNERAGNVRRVLNSIANAPHRFSQSLTQDNEEERSNLTQNIL